MFVISSPTRSKVMRSGFLNLMQLFSMLARVNATSIKDALVMTVGAGRISFMVEPYSYHIWYGTPGMMAHLIDAIVPWTLIGFVWWKMK